MGTPGMAFIRVDGAVKRIRSRYDGHIDSFGHGCAQTIGAMPMGALAAAARAFKILGEGDSEDRSAGALAPSEALSNYADLCGARLGPQARQECMGLARHQSSFAVPYVGLGPVLLSGAGSDCSDWGYDYGYLVDLDAEVFGLIHQEEDGQNIQLFWKMSFDELRQIRSETALAAAFEQLAQMDFDWDAGATPKLQKAVDAILRKAAKAAPDAEAPLGDGEEAARAEIMALPDPVFADASAERSGRSGANFDFTDPLHALFVQGALQLAGQTDLVARQLHLDSRFGVAEDGSGSGQILARRRADPGAERWQEALNDSLRNMLKTLGHEGSSFAGGGWGGEEAKEAALKDWGDVCMSATDLLAQLASFEGDQVATRWDRFDIGLCGFLRREDWMAQAKISLASAVIDQRDALSLAAYALGTADAELAALVGACPALGAISQLDAKSRQRLAAHGATGIRLAGALSPKRALEWAEAFAAGPFGSLAADARTADRLWIQSPATCIAAKARSLIDTLQGKEAKNRFGMSF